MSYIWSWAPGHPDTSKGDCAVVDVTEGRWFSKDCSTNDIPTACRLISGPEPLWVLSQESQQQGVCPQGYLFDVPRSGKQNLNLKYVMADFHVNQVWIPMYAPAWQLPNTIYYAEIVQ
eukprot:TRINITY_DN2910_c1_g1_i1.p12 TRINITY_DN2910_c1_g1~~TRINITY_DN2910_c1_g1_i1.p12  ORF type:complete len:132 (-),score=10.14 TRINITY_DN2910_c1_g1_i1:3212-3565(-)